jgi:hypothetical protein
MKKKTMDGSPICDTIEISEDLIPGGTITEDGSDNSNTPVSEFRGK